MSKTITKTFEHVNTLKNVSDDLISTGIDQDQIYIDEDKKQVKLVIPAAIEPEILEILSRHQPID